MRAMKQAVVRVCRFLECLNVDSLLTWIAGPVGPQFKVQAVGLGWRIVDVHGHVLASRTVFASREHAQIFAQRLNDYDD